MKTFIVVGLLTMTSVSASIDHTGSQPAPSSSEIARNRACFEDLEKQGCGDPGEEPQHFRSCLANAYPSLTAYCKTKMQELYGQ